MIYYQIGSETENLSTKDMEKGLFEALNKLGKRNKVLAIPPDNTRLHSRAGELTKMIYNYFGNSIN